MDRQQILRINELARKAREEGLSPQEKEEQQALRQAYIRACRENLRAQLEAVVLVDEDGRQTPLRRAEPGGGTM